MYTFPVVEKSLYSIYNIEHIHPRKQRIIRDILREIPVINVFGSSIRWDCNEKSDLDLLLDKNEIKISKEEVFKILTRIVDSDFDILWRDEIIDDVNKFQKDNIIDGSIKVYER